MRENTDVRVFGRGALARIQLAPVVVMRQEEDRLGRRYQQCGARLHPAGQVVEIRLLLKAEHRVAAFRLAGKKNHAIERFLKVSPAAMKLIERYFGPGG